MDTKNLTDEERIKILIKVKGQLRNGDNHCICTAIESVTGKVVGETYRNVRKMFPELAQHKPKNRFIVLDGNWWPDHKVKVRLDVCDLMITEIKSKINA